MTPRGNGGPDSLRRRFLARQTSDDPGAFALRHETEEPDRTSARSATLAAAITLLARLAFWFGGDRRDNDRGGRVFGALAMMIVAPIAAALIQMAISRSREYDADAASAKYTGTPYELVSGLQKLESYSKRIPMEATPSTAHLFIIKPKLGMGLGNLFSTHPSTEDRIRRLQAMRRTKPASAEKRPTASLPAIRGFSRAMSQTLTAPSPEPPSRSAISAAVRWAQRITVPPRRSRCACCRIRWKRSAANSI